MTFSSYPRHRLVSLVRPPRPSGDPLRSWRAPFTFPLHSSPPAGRPVYVVPSTSDFSIRLYLESLFGATRDFPHRLFFARIPLPVALTSKCLSPPFRPPGFFTLPGMLFCPLRSLRIFWQPPPRRVLIFLYPVKILRFFASRASHQQRRPSPCFLPKRVRSIFWPFQ